ncbi:hypothetical protein IC582_001547 [Cucumis melo]
MNELPAECVGRILAFTSLKDVCRLAGVSSMFRSAADSDFVWKNFVPVNYKEIIITSSASSFCSFLNLLLKKPLYIGTGNTSGLILDKQSERLSYVIGANELKCMDVRGRLEYISHFQSRFRELAKVEYDCGLAIEGRIEVKNLNPEAHYSVYMVFGSSSEESLKYKRFVVLEMEEGKMMRVGESLKQRRREDGWFEILMGGFCIRRDNAFIHFFVGEDKYPLTAGCFTIRSIHLRLT